jgi:hypothetical protein
MKPAYARNISIEGTANIETVHVDKGQYVTVWLDGFQVELYVTKMGRRRIFVNSLEPTEVLIASFAVYNQYPLYEDEEEDLYNERSVKNNEDC